MSACRSENPSTRSGRSSTMRSIFALVNAETFGFSLRARGGPHGEAGDADDAPVLAQQVQRLGGLLGEADDALGEPRWAFMERAVHGETSMHRRCATTVSWPMWVRFWSFLDRLFFGPASIGPRPPAVLMRVLRYPYAVVRDLCARRHQPARDGPGLHDAAVARPAHRLRFAVLKGFGAHRDLEPVVYEFFRPMGEHGAAEITTRVMEFADRVSSGVVGSVGFALLLWTLLGTIKKVEDSFNFLWRVEQPRSFARRVAEYLSLLIIGPILLVGFIGLSHAALGGPLAATSRTLPLLQQLNRGCSSGSRRT